MGYTTLFRPKKDSNLIINNIHIFTHSRRRTQKEKKSKKAFFCKKKLQTFCCFKIKHYLCIAIEKQMHS